MFEDFLSTGVDIELHFLFQCGLTRGLPGGKEDREPDFGVDVYGNGRLIEPFLKKPFGFGTRGMAQTDQASKFIRGQLFISGHSFAIPDLGVFVPLLGISDAAPAGSHNEITFSFKTGKPGIFRFQCFVPCGAGSIYGNGNAMSSFGYMQGMLVVQ